MNENVLNETDFKLILQNFRPYENIQYVCSKCIPLTQNVEGFMGDYFTLHIIYKINNVEEEIKFFVKQAPTTEVQEQIAKERNLYKKEIFFLDFVLKEYEKYNLESSFAPKCYYSKSDQVLVMENLVYNRYKLSEKNKFYDLDQCKVGLVALAEYHGSSMLYEEIKSQELGKIYRFDREYPEMFEENYYDLTFEKPIVTELAEKTIRSIKYILSKHDNFKYTKDFLSYLTMENLLECFTLKTEFRKATGHGDLWYNNIFFKYEQSKITKCAIVDYQVMRYFYPAFDVLIFIFLNTSREFRKLHLPYLLKYYYETLSEIFVKRGFNIKDVLPLQDFNETLKLVEINAMFTVCSIETLVSMSEESLKELIGAMNRNINNTFQYHYELFCRDFEIDPHYRKMLSDAVHDLYDSYVKSLNKVAEEIFL